jgi:hypothetical protein
VRDPGSRETAEIRPADRRQGSQRTEAADRHAGSSGNGWPSWPHPALLSPVRPAGDVRSPVMEDAFAVVQRRKRQLGFDTKPDSERQPPQRRERRPGFDSKPELEPKPERRPQKRTE